MDRQQAALRYYPFIRRIARRVARRLPAHVGIDDIVAAGLMGLMDSLDKYNPEKCDRFEKYAEFRIRGAMLDELRGADHLTRDQRTSINQLKRALSHLETRHGRTPEPEEVAKEMGCDLEQYYQVVSRMHASRLLGLEGTPAVSLERRAVQSAEPEKDERRVTLKQAVSRLPSRLQLVVNMYYFEDMNLKEIGRVLGLTESRICQLHRQAMELLRGELA